MRRLGIKTVYLAALTAVSIVTFVAFSLFDVHVQQQQTEEALLEEARTFAREMDAVWQFMDNSQNVINYSSAGDFDFKGLHCSVVGKSVGAIFSAGNDYTIRYTNFNPRSAMDQPDEFETAALTRFNENKEIREYYGIADFEGEERFRYLQALKVDESCLECHGEPAGELDITEHVKEGWTLDSVGGAISIVIPVDQQKNAMTANVMRDAAFFLLLSLVIGLVVLLVTTVFVFGPMNRMKNAFSAVGAGRSQISVESGGATKEVSEVIDCFNTMAEEVRSVYANLEEQVADRTLDLKRANEKLERANEKLERQRDDLTALSVRLQEEARFKSDLLSMVNHELRTPLTAIITLSQVSVEAGELEGGRDAVEQKSWEEVRKNGTILLEMINNMLDIARSDAGGMKASCEVMDIGDVVSSVRSAIAPLAQRFRVSFESHVASDVPLVSGDYEKTQRILENLLGNAVKFTPDGGHVCLRVECEPASGDVVMRVIDNGIGIHPDDQERIFERFVQVDSTSTRKYNGSGLGLALVKEYAEIQGFSVAVESVLGAGSEFSVRIPAGCTVISCEEGEG
ncbi:c-type heme family protein [Adlercreutzia aquisgranensis]|uniref:histidine kinase n=1 Tax=Muribaculaceae bacterium Z82 TaxID=2304548 RepID=A0A7C9JN80_9BACT|nr:DUF3365 domain-containing protein [Adlercreutzia aquisgranensis]